jgi:hypothetical protein
VGHRHRRARRLDQAIDLIDADHHASFPDLELERAGNVRLERRAGVHGPDEQQPPRHSARFGRGARPTDEPCSIAVLPAAHTEVLRVLINLLV